MPTIRPTIEMVDWPIDEGTLGVVGVAPWATVEFSRAFYRLIKAAKDWHYPRIIVDNNTKIPSRGRYLELGETDPSPAIAETIAELANMGATVAVVPCNTAHILYDRWAADSSIPVPSIISATVAHARDLGSRCICPAVSTSLSRYDLYGKELEDQNLECRRLSQVEQSIITAAIAEVKLHETVRPATLKKISRFADILARDGVDCILLGCTELSGTTYLFEERGIKTADSNQALAIAALRLLNFPDARMRLPVTSVLSDKR